MHTRDHDLPPAEEPFGVWDPSGLLRLQTPCMYVWISLVMSGLSFRLGWFDVLLQPERCF